MGSQISPVLPAIKVKKVLLKRFRDEVVIEPAPEELLKTLQAVSHIAVQDPKFGFSTKKAAANLFTLVEPTRSLFVKMGLKQVVTRVLKDAGYQVENQLWRLEPLPSPDFTNLKRFQLIDQRLLEAVYRVERALIKIDPERIVPSTLVAQIALAWPDKRIAVLVSRIDEANRIVRELRQYVPEAVAHHSGRRLPCYSSNLRQQKAGYHLCSHPSRLLVTTYQYANMPPLYADEYDIVFALNAQEALSDWGQESLERSFQARIYGLLDSSAELSPLEQDLAATHFGFDEISIPRHGHDERHVHIFWARICGGARVPATADILTLKRQGLWSHGLRNRRIAKLATELRKQLPVEGEDIRPGDISAILDDPKAGKGVIVLVENVEHALKLARRLPNWALITGPCVNPAGLSNEDQAALKQRKSQRHSQAQFAIVTFAGLDAVDLDQVEFVIRADGGVGLPPIAPNQLVVPNGKKFNCLKLVDFQDSHCHCLQRRSKKRSEAYERRGWFGKGVVWSEARVERFLATRHGGSKHERIRQH